MFQTLFLSKNSYFFLAIKLFSIILIVSNISSIDAKIKAKDLLLVTVATQSTDGFQRFNRSVNIYGLKLNVLGLNQPWKGGDVARKPGGGQKIILLREFLETIRDQNDLVILFTDSYDVIINGDRKDILKKFHSFDARIVFSAEKYCWPDSSLASKYPKSNGKRYLNSGGFIGYANDLYELVNADRIRNDDDDQLYYTRLYLDPKYRDQLRIKLDTNSLLFQNLNGEIQDVELRFTQAQTIDRKNADAFLFNKAFQSDPIIVHGNGASKIPLNSLGNYLAKSWHPAIGCISCDESTFSLESIDVTSWPHVLLALTILKPTPFFAEFLEYLTEIDYPKERITLFIQSRTDYHSTQIEDFMDDFKLIYRDVIQGEHSPKSEEWQMRNAYLDECLLVNCDYLFVVDSDARIINPNTLRNLIETNRSIIAPMLVRPKQFWSNFWGTITDDGYYSRSHDYLQIIKNERRGIWNVPFISTAYLIKSTLLKGSDHQPLSYRSTRSETEENDEAIDPDMFFCHKLRSSGHFMFVTNVEDFGHLAQMDTLDVSLKHPEFYEIYTNEIEWRKRYIHPNYSQNFLEVNLIEQPCPDVYWFPVVTPIFCRHLIEIMENFGEWSSGKNQDPRLAGGYENVPTRDIHMNQVGLEQHWLYFLREYIRPVQEKIFIGYYHDPPKSIMNFVVRYHPNEQANLRPHHDSSTYTINIALNRPGIDYEGGGCRFLRYNCSLTNLRVGWSLIHPGRLTHYHEGLTVTKGVRYIMVSFVDP
ncbi:Multifunctional procollagen lysine hydroxylase and glycosyltransferase LH3 [Sarcoptes scabiei]|nr:Multifunctional procollagen lysine hydroxylase and glycosyltransferase LH3 [Sarcoptes scabiei]